MHPGVDFAIAEMNKEMESIFGESPPSSFSGSQSMQEAQNAHLVTSQTETGLSHVDSNGEARMVDVSIKEDTKRTAKASCKVVLGEKAYRLVAANEIAKGDVLNVAKLAGIIGAKHTGLLIPLCHNINLSHVSLDLVLNGKDFSVGIVGQTATTGKTGVEMEAMTAVSIAGLTVYDMCKAVSKDIQITEVRLDEKTGGKSGNWIGKN